MIRLDRLVAGLPGVVVRGAGDVAVEDVFLDSRRVRPGSLFAALPGERTDGRRFVPEALARGAVAVLAPPPCPPLPGGVAGIEAERPRRTLGLLCRRLHGEPDGSLDLVGVTGTDGKTTTVTLLGAALREAGIPAATLGTLGFAGPGLEAATALTTPEAPDLWRLLARARDAGLAAVAMEVSSVALARHRVHGASFRVAVLTTLGRDHLDFHPSLEDYHGAKRRLFETLDASAVAVLPAGRPGVEAFAAAASPARVVRYSGGNGPGNADVRARIVRLPEGRREAVVETAGTVTRVPTRLCAPWDGANLAAAVAAAAALGADPAAAARGAAGVPGVPGRWEPVEAGQPFPVIVDYAHTPDALSRALAALREETRGGRAIVVFGCGGDRDRGKRRPMGRIAGRLADLVIVTDDNPRGEDPEEIAREVLAGVREGAARAFRVADREEAIARAVRMAEPGDAVLVAGKGHEDYQEVDGRRLPFDDREVARALLAGRVSR